MTQYLFSRRRLLCGLFSGLIAWLCPRPSRAVASPRSQPKLVNYRTVYVYDAENNHIGTYYYAGEVATVPASTSTSPYSYSYDVKSGNGRKRKENRTAKNETGTA